MFNLKHLWKVITSFPMKEEENKKKLLKNSVGFVINMTVKWWNLSGPLCIRKVDSLMLGRVSSQVALYQLLLRWIQGRASSTCSFLSSCPENPSCLPQAPHPLAPWVRAVTITQDMVSQFQFPRFGSTDTGGQWPQRKVSRSLCSWWQVGKGRFLIKVEINLFRLAELKYLFT